MTPLFWLAAAIMIVGGVMLLVSFGAPALWIAVITVGIALVVITRTRGHHTL